MKFDFGHAAVIAASVIGIVGPDLVAKLTSSEVGTTSKVVQALVIVLASVAGLLKQSPLPAPSAVVSDITAIVSAVGK